ncbi:MAG: LicD family protein, partial [Synergistaceae bacterium]|nr:LicD family protein [Synergistaceae bacterium]
KLVQPYINYLVKTNKPDDYLKLKRDNVFSKYLFDENKSDKIIFPWRLPPNEKLYTYKQIFYYEDFKSTIEVPFEDTTMRVPVGYDRYLTMDFGDYMTLPPEDKRRSLHIETAKIIDFERSYKYYQERLN